jgi:hypothetical protein|tara:strand:+ start:239 stop:1666 length:1428 start_codon:yes stop_codon:yes gene_type:complete
MAKAEDFTIKNISIWKVGEEMNEPYSILTNTVLGFQYFEDIFSPSISAALVIMDKAANLPAYMPIQGFEKVVIEVKDYKGDDHQFDFRVWKIGNRVSDKKGQGYTLGLIGDQGLTNEGVTVNKPLVGKPDAIVKEVLMKYLNVPEAMIETEESVNLMKIFPSGKSPFTVIRDLQARSISKNSLGGGIGKKASSNDTKGDSKPNHSSDVADNAKILKGTAGYYFWEDRDGFNFKSIDALASTDEEKFGGSGPVATYEYAPAMTDNEIGNDRKIQEVTFRSELDLLKKMREGAFSTQCAFFDINTGVYDEYIYKLSDNWKQMAHLSPQTELPKGQKDLSQFPTRRLSTVINHEYWYNGTEVASNESKDNSDEPSEITDNQKQFLVQSISRAGIMFNQQLAISVTGNLDLRAGQKIEVLIPNQVPEQDKEKLGSFDPEHSGIYLIRKLNHQFDRITMNVYTVLELIRDGFGHEETKIK